MATASPEGSFLLSPRKKKIDVIGELLQGYESASHLKFLLQKPFEDDCPLSAHQHLAIVLRSFTHSLSLLTSSSSDVAQNLVVPGENEPPTPDYCLYRKSPDASETRGRSAPANKSRRGCYKRRRTKQTWTVVSSTADDNHAWRKYGQKDILNFKFPRSYMRCTRKYEQGCRAVKQVQRIQEKPELYQITYIGYHTCKDILKTPQVVADSGNNWESFFAADSKNIPSNEVNNKVHLPIIKQEHRRRRRRPKEETPSDDFTDSSLDPSLWSDLKDLSEAAMVPLGCSDNNNADTVYSCCSGSLDFGVDDSVHFGSDDFHFNG